MKNLFSLLLVALTPALFVSCHDDNQDELPLPQQKSNANFIAANATIRETFAEGYTLQVHLSEYAVVNGTVVISAQAVKGLYGTHYITDPAFVNGKLSLMAQRGSAVVSFRVLPVNNSLITGDIKVDFTITETTGNIEIGTKVTERFTITDDELTNMPRGYEIGAGAWSTRKSYEYNGLGMISRVIWNAFTPYHTSGADMYYYNEEGQLQRIYKYPDDIFVSFTWSNGLIVREDKYHNEELHEFIEYKYDDYGNVGSYTTNVRQPGGDFKLTTLTVLTYSTDNNLHNKTILVPQGDREEFVPIASYTWEFYTNIPNAFPIQILPNKPAQTTMPSLYRVEENGVNLTYYFTYEFQSDGLVGKRITSGASSETAAYFYY